MGWHCARKEGKRGGSEANEKRNGLLLYSSAQIISVATKADASKPKPQLMASHRDLFLNLESLCVFECYL